MVDVSRWLAEHGLGHHAEAFAQMALPATSCANSPMPI
jgi:hypothetical protein